MKNIRFKVKDGTNSNLGEIDVLSVTRTGIHGISEREEVDGLVSLEHWELETDETEISFDEGKTFHLVKDIEQILKKNTDE